MRAAGSRLQAQRQCCLHFSCGLLHCWARAWPRGTGAASGCGRKRLSSWQRVDQRRRAHKSARDQALKLRRPGKRRCTLAERRPTACWAAPRPQAQRTAPCVYENACVLSNAAWSFGKRSSHRMAVVVPHRDAALHRFAAAQLAASAVVASHLAAMSPRDIESRPLPPLVELWPTLMEAAEQALGAPQPPVVQVLTRLCNVALGARDDTLEQTPDARMREIEHRAVDMQATLQEALDSGKPVAQRVAVAALAALELASTTHFPLQVPLPAALHAGLANMTQDTAMDGVLLQLARWDGLRAEHMYLQPLCSAPAVRKLAACRTARSSQVLLAHTSPGALGNGPCHTAANGAGIAFEGNNTYPAQEAAPVAVGGAPFSAAHVAVQFSERPCVRHAAVMELAQHCFVRPMPGGGANPSHLLRYASGVLSFALGDGSALAAELGTARAPASVDALVLHGGTGSSVGATVMNAFVTQVLLDALPASPDFRLLTLHKAEEARSPYARLLCARVLTVVASDAPSRQGMHNLASLASAAFKQWGRGAGNRRPASLSALFGSWQGVRPGRSPSFGRLWRLPQVERAKAAGLLRGRAVPPRYPCPPSIGVAQRGEGSALRRFLNLQQVLEALAKAMGQHGLPPVQTFTPEVPLSEQAAFYERHAVVVTPYGSHMTAVALAGHPRLALLAVMAYPANNAVFQHEYAGVWGGALYLSPGHQPNATRLPDGVMLQPEPMWEAVQRERMLTWWDAQPVNSFDAFRYGDFVADGMDAYDVRNRLLQLDLLVDTHRLVRDLRKAVLHASRGTCDLDMLGSA